MNATTHSGEPYFQTPIQNEHYFLLGTDIELALVLHCGYNDLNQASRLTWHAHEGFEFVLVMEGFAYYEFEDSTSLELAGGQYFVSMPGQRHRGRLDISMPSKLCWIIFNPEGIEARTNTTLEHHDLATIIERCRSKERQVCSISREMQTLLILFRDAVRYDSAADKRPLHAARIRSLICQLIIESTENLLHGQTNKPKELVESIKREFEQSYASELNIEEIASKHSLHRSQFYSIFKAATGQTPLDYLQRQRIKQAQNLLSDTQISVTEIAITTGFNSSQYFSRVFRKYAGCTPSQYRVGRTTA